MKTKIIKWFNKKILKKMDKDKIGGYDVFVLPNKKIVISGHIELTFATKLEALIYINSVNSIEIKELQKEEAKAKRLLDK